MGIGDRFRAKPSESKEDKEFYTRMAEITSRRYGNSSPTGSSFQANTGLIARPDRPPWYPLPSPSIDDLEYEILKAKYERMKGENEKLKKENEILREKIEKSGDKKT